MSLKKLRNALSQRIPYRTGTIKAEYSDLFLYYGSDSAARCVSLLDKQNEVAHKRKKAVELFDYNRG